ncbi:hypothetical protein EHS25_007770 [Saitozyma podzolica]|uniref:SCP domain-containing protein n=1 Tax=Saitozyma podzolica TaxID=1890683 RepID=A0A427YQM2_9TREE|nr:hypothetical protein EHS25_007770 [Saitozyma podzolica]
MLYALASPVTIQRRQGGSPSTAASRGQGFLSNLLGLITSFENSADDNSSVDFRGIFASALSYAEAQASSAAARIGAARPAASSTSSAASGGITPALKVASAPASSSSSSSSSKSAGASANPTALGVGAVAPSSSASKSSSSSASSSASSASSSKSSSSASAASVSGTTRPSSASLSLTPSSSSKASSSVSSSTSSKPTSSAVPTTSSSSASATSGTEDTADQPTFLSLHNAFRAHYGASAVTWNDTLAVYAYNAAKTCKYGHTGGPYGENIAAGVGGGYDVTKGFNSWANEASLYNYSSPGYSGTTGHFTQLVWKATSQIGCAAVTCPDGSIFTGYGQNSLYLVCEYYVPGNWVDPSNSANTAKYFTQNVGPYQA